MIKMPAIVLERPKLSRPMWKALKSHIIRERQRKKQEQEADAEVERQRREREDQQKEHEMTLEETKDQVAKSESRLAQLKEDKHQLFLQLKKVLNEDDTRKKIKESNFNEMMLIHGYPGPPIAIHPHGPPLFLHNTVAQPRPVYAKGIKEDPLTVQPPSLYTPAMNMIPPPSHQTQGPPQQKRSRSPSPPPQPLYHSFKPQAPASYNPKTAGNPYSSTPAAPGSIFYTHTGSVSAAHSAAAGYPAPGSLYSYPSGHSSSSRPTYAAPVPPPSKEEGPPPQKHPPPPSAMYLSHSPQITSRSAHTPRNSGPPMTQGYHHQSMEHLMKSTTAYGAPEQDKFYLSSHGPSPSVSSVGGSSSSNSGMRSHGTLLAPITVPGSSSHSSGIPIQQSSHGKSGSITSGHPLRPPPSTGYHTSGQSPRLVYTQSSGQPPQPSRYVYGNSNQRDI